MYRVRFCFDPMKLFNCLNAFGCESLRIAAVFRVSGIITSLLIL